MQECINCFGIFLLKVKFNTVQSVISLYKCVHVNKGVIQI